MDGAKKKGFSEEVAERGLRPHRALCRLCLQQGARLQLRPHRLPDRLSQGQLPGGIHDRFPDHPRRPAGEGGQRRRRVPPPGHHGAAAGYQPQPGSISPSKRTATAQPAIRFGLAAIKNVGAGAVEPIIAERNKSGDFQIDRRPVPPLRPARRQPARAGKPDQGRGPGLPGRPRHPAQQRQPHPVPGAAGAAPARDRPVHHVRPLGRSGAGAPARALTWRPPRSPTGRRLPGRKS